MKTRIALAIAMLGLTVTGAAWAQSSLEGSADSRTSASATAERGVRAAETSRGAASAAAGQAAMRFEEGTELKAELTRRIDARRAAPGDEVQAELVEDVESNGMTLEKGTRLVGRVTDVRPRGAFGDASAGARSELGIVFEKAVVGRDHEVPIHATIQALAAAEGRMQAATREPGALGRQAEPRASRAPASAGLSGAVSGAGGVVGGAVRGGAGAAGSLGGGIGGVPARSGEITGEIGGAARAAGTVYQSQGAVGGTDTVGRIRAGSAGVFGLEGMELVSRAAAGTSAAGRADGAGTSVITSASGNVRLESGTQMLLVASGSSQASARVGR